MRRLVRQHFVLWLALALAVLLGMLLGGCGNGGKSQKKPEAITKLLAVPPAKFVGGVPIPNDEQIEITLLCGFQSGSYHMSYNMPEGEVALSELQLVGRPVYCVSVAVVDGETSKFSNEVSFTCPRADNCRK